MPANIKRFRLITIFFDPATKQLQTYDEKFDFDLNIHATGLSYALDCMADSVRNRINRASREKKEVRHITLAALN